MRMFLNSGLLAAAGVCFAPPDGGGGPAELKSMADVSTALGGITAAMKKTHDAVKESAETVNKEIKNLGTVTGETKEKADKALTEAAAARETANKLEQLFARFREGGGYEPAKSAGAQVATSEKYQAWRKDATAGGKIRIPVTNMISSATTDADGSAGDLVVRQRVSGIIIPPQRRMTVRDLLAPGRTESNLIEYVKETGFTNNAGPQTGGVEGGTKVESTLKFQDVSVGVKTIAHYMKASKQILDDAKMLQSHIDVRLRYGLAYEEERQLLNGDNSGGELWGLIPQATAFSAEFTPDDWNMIDTIRLAYLQAALAEWPATGVVLHPTDWARMELTKDTQGRYIFAQAQGVARPTLWGEPVVATPAMTADHFLAGAFIPAAQIFDREDSNVQISTENEDDFIKNKVTVRAEERLALAVYRPEALIYGQFDHS